MSFSLDLWIWTFKCNQILDIFVKDNKLINNAKCTEKYSKFVALFYHLLRL